MENIIYFYTGTGNSFYTAKRLAEITGSTELAPMIKGSVKRTFKRVGFVFPVHMWGVPGPVLDFITALETSHGEYYFAAAVNAGEVSNTLVQLKKMMALKGMQLSAGFDIALPSNYIPWGGPGTADEVRLINEKAEKRIIEAGAYALAMNKGRLDMGPLWQRVVYTWLYKSAFKWVSYMDKSFWVDAKCNSCGICEKICPACNITLESGKPVWHKKCQQCLACIQWCPKEAIQYGKKTPQYARYHHGKIKVSDMLEITDRQ